MRHLSPTELARLAIGGNVPALRELTCRDGDEAKLAIVQVVRAKRRGSPGARRAIRVCNRRTVRRLNRSWERGELLAVQRNTGSGPETHADWLAHRPSGHAPRRATSARTRGGRRGTRSGSASRAGPRSDDDPGESDLDPVALHTCASNERSMPARAARTPIWGIEWLLRALPSGGAT